MPRSGAHDFARGLDAALAHTDTKRDLGVLSGALLAEQRLLHATATGSFEGLEKAITAVVIETVAGAFEGVDDMGPVMAWRTLFTWRLPDAPPELVAMIDKLLPSGNRSGSSGGAGGAGGRGRSANDPGSKFGQGIAKMSTKKVMLSVKRTKDGWVVREGYDKKYETNHPFSAGVEFITDDGVSIARCGHAIALDFLDEKGGVGGSGGSSHPSPWLSFYHRAEGETWQLTRGGIVTIRSK